MLQTKPKNELVALLRDVELDPRCRQFITISTAPQQSNTIIQSIVSGHPAAANAFQSAGAAGAAAVLCSEALRDLLACLPLQVLERQRVLQRAQTCAEVAVRLCDLPIEIPAPTVVAACTWLDAGKALLDAIAPVPTPPQPDAPGPAAAHVLEAETEAFGVDHALAGKWLAEHWGLPTAITEAIWLHHHTLSTVEVAADQPRLCYFVALADALAEIRLGEAQPHATPWIEDLCKRLGLRPKEALAAARPSERAASVPSPVKPTAPPMAMPSNAETRYRALCSMHEQLHAAADPTEALLALAGGLFEAFNCPAGQCAALGAFVGWDHAAPICHVTPPTANLPGGTLLPLAHGAQVHGEVQLQLPQGSTTPISALLVEIARATESTAAVLTRLAANTSAATRTEAFATALHRAEAQRQRGLQSERLAGLAKFAAGAAHEINNPLAVISGRAQLLLSQASAPEQQRSLDTIVQQSRRISKIVSDLMQFARPPEPKRSLTGIQHLLHQLVGTMRERLQEKNIAVEENYADVLPRVAIDRHQVEQALLHGLLNAEHAMESSGGTLYIQVQAAANGEQIEVLVRDTGPGIPVNDLARVFDPFFTTKQFHEGSTGLGLTVTRSIIEAHHGAVTIASRVGEGTTLTFHLPADHTASMPTPSQPPNRVVQTPPSKRVGLSPLEAEHGLPESHSANTTPNEMRTTDNARHETQEVHMAADDGPSTDAPEPATTATTATIHSIHEAAPAPSLSATQTEAIIDRVFPRPGTPATPRATHIAASAVPAHGDRRVLVIEENEDLREVLRAALASHGYQIETVPDGLEGLASALAHPPALILASTQLTGVDIVTLVRQIRQRYANIPVIILGGPGADDLAPEALQAGARALLHKPFDFERLLQEIAPHLATKSVA